MVRRTSIKHAGKEKFGNEKASACRCYRSWIYGIWYFECACKQRRVRVRLSDPSENQFRMQMLVVINTSKKWQRERELNLSKPQKLAHISPGLSTEGFSSTDVVIEAVFENLELKQKLLVGVRGIRKRKNRIFASNTSALPIADIAKIQVNLKEFLECTSFTC